MDIVILFFLLQYPQNRSFNPYFVYTVTPVIYELCNCKHKRYGNYGKESFNFIIQSAP